MKNRILLMILGVLVSGSVVFGQESNVTTAAIEYNKIKNMFSEVGDISPEAKHSIIIAKTAIDAAAAHPETKEDQKMFFYKGNIYIGLAYFLAKDPTIVPISDEDAFNTGIKAWEMGIASGGRYTDDIRGAVISQNAGLFYVADELFKNENYQMAADAYETCDKLMKAIGIVDTTIIYNAGVSYELAKNYQKAAEMYSQLANMNYRGAKGAILAANAYTKLGSFDMALEVLSRVQNYYPNDIELLMTIVNVNLAAGNIMGAEAVLRSTIEKDPNNAQLHYNVGTIYMELKENQKAEEELRIALQIDPAYAEARYQLGALLYNWSVQLRKEGNMHHSNKKLEDALVEFEKYIKQNPNDKALLNTLYQVYNQQGNQEKAAEYKARIDAL